MAEQQTDFMSLVAPLIVSDGSLRWIDTASDPLAVDEIGSAIARSVEHARPEAVACWVGDDEVVLAHTVARALRVPVLRAEEDMGLLTMQTDPGERVGTVLMLATLWSGWRPSAPLYSMLKERGTSVSAVVSLLPGEPRPDLIPDDIPFRVLAAV